MRGGGTGVGAVVWIGFGRGGPAVAQFDVRSFAECHGPALDKGFLFFLFVFFAECPVSGTRQRPPLPSARSGTRQRIFFLLPDFFL